MVFSVLWRFDRCLILFFFKVLWVFLFRLLVLLFYKKWYDLVSFGRVWLCFLSVEMVCCRCLFKVLVIGVSFLIFGCKSVNKWGFLMVWRKCVLMLLSFFRFSCFGVLFMLVRLNMVVVLFMVNIFWLLWF